MKWTLQPGLMAPLTLTEWFLMAAVFILLIFAGWQAIKFAKMIFQIIKGV